MRRKLATLGFVFIIGLIGGYLWGSGQQPDMEKVPVVRYLPFSTPNTFEPTVPDVTKQYKPLEREEVRVDTVYVPKEINDYVVAERQPIEVTPSEVRFKYFDHETRRWGVDIFDVPERRFEIGLYLDAFMWDFEWEDPTIGLALETTYRNLTIGVGPYYSVGSEQMMILTRIKLELL